MINVERQDDKLLLLLNRTDKANAINTQMLEMLVAGVSGASARLLMISNEGSVFSAGADLDEVENSDLATSPLWEELSGAVAAFPGLSVAALNGTAAGGSLGMVLACDVRIAKPGSEAFYPVMRLGHLPQPSDAGRLSSLVGPAKAKMMLMGGARLSDQEALAAGLWDRIDDQPIQAAMALAKDVLAAPDGHAEAVKALF